MMRNERGFTIMELLVVIVIIGVLAAIGIPAYNNMTTRSRATACQANKRTIATAVGMYYADHEKYPASGATSTLVDTNNNLYIDNVATLLCPTDNSAYTIVNDGTNVSVHCDNHDDLVIK